MSDNITTDWLKDNYPENFKDFYNNLDSTNNFKLGVQIVNNSNNDNPKYETLEAAGFDIRAFISENIVLGSLDRYIVPTGLYMDIPKGFELQIRPRSGLAAKNGISVLNSPGTIDSDYTGEIKIILVNLSKEDFIISSGDRIAQGVFSTVTNSNVLDFNFVTKIEKVTERGAGGFGSTGIK